MPTATRGTDHFGEPSGHGTWVHEAITEGLIDPALTVQLGIRSIRRA
jgi:agmatinase